VSERSNGQGCRWGLLLVGVCGLACEDPLTDPAVIAGPRIVAARVSAEVDPTIAEPSAGQGASIDWLVVSNEAGAFSAHVVWCSAAPSVLGAPRCAGGPLAQQTATGTYGEPLRLQFQVPAEIEPGGAWLAWLGICDASVGAESAEFDAVASAFRCPDGVALSGFYRGFVPEGAPNRNPTLADDLLFLDGATWPAAEPDETGSPGPREACADRGLPLLRAEQRSSVGFELIGDDREALESEPDRYAAHARESLVYTHLASHPGLDRAFSSIDHDAEQLGFELPFEPAPVARGEVPPGPGGERVSFYLLVRDERGGVDWLRRDGCLLPP
jgi:hypothetical protein